MTEPKLDPRIVRTKEAIQTVFKRVTCDSRFDYIRERMQNRVTKQAAESRPLKGI